MQRIPRYRRLILENGADAAVADNWLVGSGTAFDAACYHQSLLVHFFLHIVCIS
jgi:hypothetical protein